MFKATLDLNNQWITFFFWFNSDVDYCKIFINFSNFSLLVFRMSFLCLCHFVIVDLICWLSCYFLLFHYEFVDLLLPFLYNDFNDISKQLQSQGKTYMSLNHYIYHVLPFFVLVLLTVMPCLCYEFINCDTLSL